MLRSVTSITGFAAAKRSKNADARMSALRRTSVREERFAGVAR
jgi:hypothetical protein